MPPEKTPQPLGNNTNEPSSIPPQPSPSPSPPSQPIAQSAPQPRQAQPNINSIYPEVTQGIGAAHQPIPSDLSTDTKGENLPTAKNDNLSKLIILVIMILGLYIAVPALLSIIGIAKIISYGKISVLSNQGAVIYVIDAVYLAVGIGLILRRELARITYVIIGVVILLISVVATINYFSNNHNLPTKSSIYSQQVNSAQSFVNSDETTISNYQHNTQIPLAQRQQVIAELETNLKNDQTKLQQAKQLQAQNSGILHNSLIQLIPTYLLAVLPLVFLTRPRVKQIFN